MIKNHFCNTLVTAILMMVPIVGLGGNTVINEEPTPFLGDDELPKRPPPLIEWGNKLLASGPIENDHITKSGQVINPHFWIYGTFRTAIQNFRTGVSTANVFEMPARLDLFAGYYWSATERILLGVRPLDQDGRFTSYVFEPRGLEGFKNEANLRITTLFIEGDFGELYPNWAKNQSKGGDLSFAIGRQPIFFQEGLIINDTIDSIALAQNSLSMPCMSNLLVTLYWGINNIDRDDNQPDNSAWLLGFHSRADTPFSTIDFDLIYVDAKENNQIAEDLLVVGLGAIQRIGHWGVSFRALGSYAPHYRTLKANNGLLLFFEANRSPHYNEDIIYVTSAIGFSHYTSAARDPSVGGPLGRLGILFASNSLGSIGSPLSNRANDIFAFAVGYEAFLNRDNQVILEAGGRLGLKRYQNDALGVALRWQIGVGQRYVFQTDIFGAARQALKPAYGTRFEFLVKM